MTTTVISTVETETAPLTFTGGNLLITGTGGVIDAASGGTALVFNISTAAPDVTIEAGALVFGDDDGIDLNANFSSAGNLAGAFTIDGSVQGNDFGLDLGGTGQGFANIVIGAQGSLSGSNGGIYIDESQDSITNYGWISSTLNSGIVATNDVHSVSITNAGTIAGGIDLQAAEGVNVSNSGLIDGNVTVSSASIVSNSGTISGNVQDFGATGTSLNNSGAITGQVNFGSYSDILDTGSIAGAVSPGSYSTLIIGAQGSVTCTEGTAVYVSSNSTIANHGLIGGGFIGRLHGIAPGGTVDQVTLVNSGIIDGGVALGSSADDTITNTGTINGGLSLGEGDQLYNTGMIHGLTGTGGVYIENDGTIAGSVNLAFGTSGGDSLSNAGKISGGITLDQADTLDNSGTLSGGITGAGNDSITNSGTIAGGISDSTAGDTVDNLGKITGGISVESAVLTNSGAIHGALDFSGQNTLYNSGTITGTVTFGGKDDTVTNSGTIHGNVILGAGDTLDTSEGIVTGKVTAATSDTFDFSGLFGHEEIRDFTGYPSHNTSFDVINFASDDFTSYTELQSHMAQVGKDVVITLDAADDIILVDTKLSHLDAHDFTFGT